MEYKKSSFLAMTNDAICTAVSKAMLLVKDDAKSRSCQKSDQTDKDFLPEISLDEVQYHDNIGDYWIVLYDRVYDITSFLQEHPGGEEILLEQAGRDATISFNGVGHSKEALQALDKYLIGILPAKERLYINSGKRVLEMLTTSLSMAT